MTRSPLWMMSAVADGSSPSGRSKGWLAAMCSPAERFVRASSRASRWELKQASIQGLKATGRGTSLGPNRSPHARRRGPGELVAPHEQQTGGRDER